MVSFGNDGNILSKTGIGSYTYGSTCPHAVTGVENIGNLISSAEQSITYNSYLKASYIEDGDYAMTIDYGPERQRWKSVLSYDDGNGMETVRSVRYHDDKDIIEEDGKYYSITYLDGGVICLKNLQTNAMSFYLTCTDMLGSVTKIVKGDRTEVFKAEYDEWGRQTVTTNTIGFIRGYTGHEMLPEFGLVNMNGRMYDPLLGRFLSPDDYVQMPMSPQGFNRYAYCMNNPMRYVDPDGEIALMPIIVGAILGATTSAVTYSLSACIENNFKWSGFFKSVGMGTLGGALSGALGSVSMSTTLGKFSNSLGFNILGQTSSSIITNMVFGNDINIKDLLPIAAGAIAGTAIPHFKAVAGNTFANVCGEILHNTTRGVITGFAYGSVSAALYGDSKRVYHGMLGGGIAGLTKSILFDLFIGTPVRYAQNVHGAVGSGTYRKGILGGGGVTFGRYMINYAKPNMYKYYIFNDKDHNINIAGGYDLLDFVDNHEWLHINQQYEMGWANFYGQIAIEYWHWIIKGHAFNPYDHYGTLDNRADLFSAKYTPRLW